MLVKTCFVIDALDHTFKVFRRFGDRENRLGQLVRVRKQQQEISPLLGILWRTCAARGCVEDLDSRFSQEMQSEGVQPDAYTASILGAGSLTLLFKI